MRLIVISDTHGSHREIEKLPKGDVLIHCGDISNIGGREDVEDFIDWFDSQPHTHKIFIAGNHDKSFDPKYNRDLLILNDEQLVDRLQNTKPFWLNILLNEIVEKNIHYLENSGVTIDGIKFWGSPITPDFYPERWAFNAPRGETIKKYWDRIPTDTDVLITHGPPVHILDWVVRGGFDVGCEDLDRRVSEIQPKFHFFGHIHESYGSEKVGKTTFANASLLNESYRMVNEPMTFKI